MTRDDMKRAAAAAAIEYVQPGMTIGVGTGSTADWFVTLLSELPVARRPAAAVASSVTVENAWPEATVCV